ncbi:unnamed protein product [Rangifer tarandus platyrhynchus]|uniref:Uncharacterized protein n=1 Tax=Rangifer tarandus platyrhynchus TaxID=3082113 RepID=A0AC60A525_RANTA
MATPKPGQAALPTWAGCAGSWEVSDRSNHLPLAEPTQTRSERHGRAGLSNFIPETGRTCVASDGVRRRKAQFQFSGATFSQGPEDAEARESWGSEMEEKTSS